MYLMGLGPGDCDRGHGPSAQWSNPGKERGTSCDYRVCPSLFGSNWVF